MSTEYVLETQGLTREFAGFCAVKDVNLKVRANTIHAMIGPNGAGKTTVFNLLSKFLAPSAGRIFYKNAEITRARPADIARRCLVRSFQISAVFLDLTLVQNVRMALLQRLGAPYQFWRSDRALDDLNPRALALLDEVGLRDMANLTAGELPYGRKRALEIATTVALDPELLLLDEPMAGLGREDIGRVSDLIRRVAKGRTVLMVEHNMSVVSALSDTITVLQRGEILAEGPYSDVSRDPRVIEAYVGSGHA